MRVGDPQRVGDPRMLGRVGDVAPQEGFNVIEDGVAFPPWESATSATCAAADGGLFRGLPALGKAVGVGTVQR